MRDTGLVIALLSRIAELERRVAGVEFRGRVHAIDAAKHAVQVVIGTDPEGHDVLSPWLPVAQTAGALKIHDIPSVGQQVAVQSASGDIEQGRVLPLHWSDGLEAPSDDPDLKVITFGSVRVETDGSSIKIMIGDTTYTMDSQQFAVSVKEIAFSGNRFEHNGLNVGSTHVHGGVVPGPASTDVPLP